MRTEYEITNAGYMSGYKTRTEYEITNAGYMNGRRYETVTELLQEYADEVENWSRRNPSFTRTHPEPVVVRVTAVENRVEI
jgi:hypothetical protein